MCKCHPAECRDEGLWRAEIERLRAALEHARGIAKHAYEQADEPGMEAALKYIAENILADEQQVNDNQRALFPGWSDKQIREHYRTVRTTMAVE